jgi:hypothetical protein
LEDWQPKVISVNVHNVSIVIHALTPELFVVCLVVFICWFGC